MPSKREHDKKADYVCKFDLTPSLAQGEYSHSPIGIPTITAMAVVTELHRGFPIPEQKARQRNFDELSIYFNTKAKQKQELMKKTLIFLKKAIRINLLKERWDYRFESIVHKKHGFKHFGCFYSCFRALRDTFLFGSHRGRCTGRLTSFQKHPMCLPCNNVTRYERYLLFSWMAYIWKELSFLFRNRHCNLFSLLQAS